MIKAGGEAYLLAIAWRHSGADPYAMYHGLDSMTYRPKGRPDLEPMPPAHPSRVKSFIYGCATYLEEMDIERMRIMAGAGAARKAASGG